jgi:NAD(P)-dependent dehydrogenase (short-subunit alcohol dehydrogenase family)
LTDGAFAPAATCRRLDGKVAIVTGGASGIGAASARRLAAEGARVAIGDINAAAADRLADELGEGVIGVAFDAADVSSVERLVETTVEHFGQLDILHNNAANLSPEHFSRDTHPVDIDFEVWDRTFAVNVRGYLAGCKYAIPHMLTRGGGAIVNTASVSGMLGDLTYVAYGSSKAAIVGLTRYVATAYGKRGIRCNAINPGPIRSAASDANIESDLSDVYAQATLVGRWGEPAEIAAAVAWLASDDAAYVTGAVIDVDGGMLSHLPYVADLLRDQSESLAAN